jgi:hypothetical protein
MVVDPVNINLTQELIVLSKELVFAYPLRDIVLDFVAYSSMAILALMIFLEISKLYSITQYEGLKHFKGAFLYFGISNLAILTLVIAFAILRFIHFSDEATAFFLLGLSIPSLLVAGISLWIAKTDLLYVITWRLFDGISTKRRFKAVFFVFLMFFVAIDSILYGISLDYFQFAGGFIYKAIIFTLILLMIRYNQNSSGRIGSITHPYYLGIIMLFTLNFLDIFTELTYNYTIADLIINGLTIIAYLIILKGIRKWTRILTI